MKKPKILFLHSELAKYFIACVKVLSENADVHVVHWRVNSEAPFRFENEDGIEFYLKDNFNQESLDQLITEIKPEVIVVSGWRDKNYLKAIKQVKNSRVKVMSLDNPWKGDLKQRIWTVLSVFKLLPLFSHCWVAGQRQKEYARKLGFKPANIIDKLYSADISFFEKVYCEKKEIKLKDRPKRFIYIGRYSKEKGVNILFEAFVEFSKERDDWELWCLGTGPLFESKELHSKIKHFGFVQPSEMGDILKDTDVFVLPSTFEPWGLVVHEMASAGFPMILSEDVGATELFLRSSENGYTIRSGSSTDLVEAFRKMAELTEKQRDGMGQASSDLSKRISPEIWAEKVLELL